MNLLTLPQSLFSLDFKVLKCCLWEIVYYSQGQNLSPRQEELCLKWQ